MLAVLTRSCLTVKKESQSQNYKVLPSREKKIPRQIFYLMNLVHFLGLLSVKLQSFKAH